MATESKDLTIDERIKKEISRLNRLFKNIPTDTLQAVASLIKNAAFMTITLEDLQTKINYDGAVATYQNGENQWGTKKSPEVEIYNTMIKNHTSILKQLTDLIPAGGPPPASKEKDPFEIIRDRENRG